MHSLGDLFFIGAEVSLFAVLVGTAIVAFKTAVLPKWWAWLGTLVGVVALVGPIGWAALTFGFPVWLLGTTVLLARKPRSAVARSGRRDVAEPVAQVL